MNKNTNTTQPAPFIFNLINADANKMHYSALFSVLNFLLHVDGSSIKDYITYLDYFTIAQYKLLSVRIIEKRNKSVPMNQHHLIIFYAMLHYITELYDSEREFTLLKEEFEDKALADMIKLQDYLPDYARDSMVILNRDFKKNNALAIAFAKIDAYKIPA
jgi:hypothetical protein